jgi:hypothetical protein
MGGQGPQKPLLSSTVTFDDISLATNEDEKPSITLSFSNDDISYIN